MNKFKVGDKVKVISHDYGTRYIGNKDIIDYIKKYDGDSRNYYSLSHISYYYFLEEELEKVIDFKDKIKFVKDLL